MIIQIKHSANTGNVPSVLANGELALNFQDQLLYYKHANGSILTLANGASIGLDQTARDEASAAFFKANGAYDKANGAVQFGFPTINVAGQNNVIATSNNDTLHLVGGTGVSITTDAPNNIITISANAAIDQFARDHANGAFDKANGAAQFSFTTLNVAGQNNIVATTNSSTLVVVAGESILITTDSANDILTLAVTTLNGGTF